MATSIGKVGIVDKGNYSAEVIYNSGDFVFYEGSTWLALKGNLLGVEPVDGENWKYLARGLSNGIATPNKAGVVKPNNDFTIGEDGTLGINPIVLEEYVEKPVQKSLTIPNTGWTAEANGPYTQKLILSVEGIRVNTIVNVAIALASEEIAQDCGLSSTNESGEGTITFYAKSVPSAAIQATYYVLEGGGEIG